MEIGAWFLIYAAVFRVAIIATGAVSIILGYRLFLRGVWPKTRSGGESTVSGKFVGTSFTMKNASPGMAFGLFGALIVGVMLVQGNPQLTMELLQKAGKTEGGPMKVTLRGDGNTENLDSLIQQGIDLERAGQTLKALESYRKATARFALPLNQLALHYLDAGRTVEALELSRMAVTLCPESADAADTLAEILMKRGDKPGAQQWREKAAALDPGRRDKLKGVQPGR